MAFEFRLPDIKGSEAEQIRAIRGYLYQLIPELSFALNTLSERVERLSEIQKNTED